MRSRFALDSFALVLTPVLGLCAPTGVVLAQDTKTSPSRIPSVLRSEELSPDVRVAIEESAEWLANNQDPGGYWPCQPPDYVMSITSLAGLALLAHGDTPNSGKHAQNIRRAIEWILKNQKLGTPGKLPYGLFYDGDLRRARADEDRMMHGHGFAMLFLAEAYGNTSQPELRKRMHEAIKRGVWLTIKTQSDIGGGIGGWMYRPDDYRDEGSVTVTQIQALRSAYNAGIAVDRGVIKRAVDYIYKSQNTDGGIKYTLRRGGPNKTSAALTAAGITVLQGAGEYSGRPLEKAYEYLRVHLNSSSATQTWFYYCHFYAAQAMYQKGGQAWANYFPEITQTLMAQRKGKKYWQSGYGPAYGTAMALLILQVPSRYLPIYQR